MKQLIKRLSVVSLCSFTPQIHGISLEDFLINHAKRNPTLLLKKYELDQSKQQMELNRPTAQGSITSTPYIKEGDYISTGLESQYNHQFENGSSAYASFNILKSFEDSHMLLKQNVTLNTQFIPIQQTEIKLGYSHPLNKNRNNSLQELLWQNSEIQNKFAKSSLITEQFNSCIEGSNKFINAYFEVETLKINQKLYQNTQELVATSAKDFNRGLISKSDFLSSKTDLLNSKKRLIETEIKSKQNILQLYLDEKTDLQDPLPILEKVFVNINYSTESEKVKASQQDIEAAKINLQKVQEENKSEVDVFFDYTQNRTQFSIGEQSNKSYIIGIKAELPLFGHKNSTKVNSASKNIYFQQEALNMMIADKNQQIKSLRNEIQNLIMLSKINTELADNIEKQLKEIKKEYLAQKTSFETFRLTRDNLINMQLNFLEEKRKKANAILNLLNVLNQYPLVCESVI